VSAYRVLARAYLGAGDYDKAAATIRDGLEIRPDDPALTELGGDVLAATGAPDDALDSWHRAFTLAPPGYGISMRFSSAFLLEKQGRLSEAAGEWRFIVGWMEAAGDTIHLDWPRRELDRLEAQLALG
jgi:tetratricopeptide (TPR) repeat protein